MPKKKDKMILALNKEDFIRVIIVTIVISLLYTVHEAFLTKALVPSNSLAIALTKGIILNTIIAFFSIYGIKFYLDKREFPKDKERLLIMGFILISIIFYDIFTILAFAFNVKFFWCAFMAIFFGKLFPFMFGTYFMIMYLESDTPKPKKKKK